MNSYQLIQERLIFFRLLTVACKMESPVQDRSREEESEQKVVQLDAEARKEDGEENELEKVKQDLQKTKAELDEAKSEVAVAQILQENLCSVSRQKVICIHPPIVQVTSTYLHYRLLLRRSWPPCRFSCQKLPWIVRWVRAWAV